MNFRQFIKLNFSFIIILSLVAITKDAAAESKKIDLVDVSATLFCNNSRKSIIFVNLSSKPKGINKITSLFYFVDGYPNSPLSNWYVTNKAYISANFTTIEMNRVESLQDSKVELSKSLSKCIVKYTTDSQKIKSNTQDLNFTIDCDFPLEGFISCKTDKTLEEKIKIRSPYDNKTLMPFERKLMLIE